MTPTEAIRYLLWYEQTGDLTDWDHEKSAMATQILKDRGMEALDSHIEETKSRLAGLEKLKRDLS